ncbi:MAG: GNAT family N-acetyltransferase [Acidobacteriota bacterium]|nr:GNAT family N-acetyltransferase [Acidobacteriota bacterium]
MLLRAFKPGDLKTLHEIDAACFPPGVSYSREELRAFITHRNSRTWVAQEGEQVIGFLVAQKAPFRSVHIITIDVAEGSRRRGAGRALLGAAEAWAAIEGAGSMELETAEDNRTAQAFYGRQGYVKARKVENYYANGAAAWVMVKRLKRGADAGQA